MSPEESLPEPLKDSRETPQPIPRTGSVEKLEQALLNYLFPVLGLGAAAAVFRDTLLEAFSSVPFWMRLLAVSAGSAAAMAWGYRRVEKTSGILAILIGLAGWTTCAIYASDGVSGIANMTTIVMMIAAAGVLWRIADITNEEMWGTLALASLFGAPWAATTRPDSMILAWIAHGVFAGVIGIEVLRRRPTWKSARIGMPLLLWSSTFLFLERLGQAEVALNDTPYLGALLIMVVPTLMGARRLPLGQRWALPCVVLTGSLIWAHDPWPLIPLAAAFVVLVAGFALVMHAVRDRSRVGQYAPRGGQFIAAAMVVAFISSGNSLSASTISVLAPLLVIVTGLSVLGELLVDSGKLRNILASAGFRQTSMNTPADSGQWALRPLWLAIVLAPVLASAMLQRLVLAGMKVLQQDLPTLNPAYVTAGLFVVMSMSLVAGVRILGFPWRDQLQSLTKVDILPEGEFKAFSQTKVALGQKGRAVPGLVWMIYAGAGLVYAVIFSEVFPEILDFISRLFNNIEGRVVVSALGLLLAPYIDHLGSWEKSTIFNAKTQPLRRVTGVLARIWLVSLAVPVLSFSIIWHREGSVSVLSQAPLILTLVWTSILAWRLWKDLEAPIPERVSVIAFSTSSTPIRRLVWLAIGSSALVFGIISLLSRVVGAGAESVSLTAAMHLVWAAAMVLLARWYKQRGLTVLALLLVVSGIPGVVFGGRMAGTLVERSLSYAIVAGVLLSIGPLWRKVSAVTPPLELGPWPEEPVEGLDNSLA